jgi:hypothetical protein
MMDTTPLHGVLTVVVGAVTGRPVLVPVPVVPGEEAVEGRLQVGLRARARLHQGQAGGGVGGENVDQTVPLALAELGDPVGEIGDSLALRVQLHDSRLHPSNPTPP